jgi:hypothetical protein
VKIRSRALITTLWARLFLGDVFLHGIGGAQYDQLTDQLIEQFFSVPPPRFMVLSATLQLPISCPAPSAAASRSIHRKLRDLTYHPERFLRQAFTSVEDVPAAARALAEEKRRWIAAPQTRANARTRCRSLRRINEQLQLHLADLRQDLLAQQSVAAARERADKILRWREYAFCLFPEETLRAFLDHLLTGL